MEFENIIYKVDGGIATIQLNRPKALNALNSDINHDIMEAIKLVQADDSVRVLIMTGSERAFAAGADVITLGNHTWDKRQIVPMVEENRYCIDISQQLMATEAILNRANKEILAAHLKHCVQEAASDAERGQKIDEFVATLGRILK